MAVPVEFGAVASVGDTYVNCNGASASDICTDCKPVVDPCRKTLDFVPTAEQILLRPMVKRWDIREVISK